MPLSSDFALDTETDRIDGDIRTCLIQTCPMDAVSIQDVVLFVGLDCYDKFFNNLEETAVNTTCHVCNLPYEFSRMKSYLLTEYEYVSKDTKKLKAGQWTALADQITVYSVKICNSYGKTLTITDDLQRVNTSLRKAGEGVRLEHPEWFGGMDEVKEHVDYNNGWSKPDHPDHEKFIHYAKVDAYTQAMIMRWVRLHGLDKNMTSASNGFQTALLGKYAAVSLAASSASDRFFSIKDFRKYYPPLTREMQDMVEESLLGGFVYGEVGTYNGTFVHLDYSSSYPYEYVFGKLGRGKVSVIKPSHPEYNNLLKSPTVLRWFVVSFDFVFKDGAGMPSINGKECRTPCNRMIGSGNKKMRGGKVTRKLYTESYLEELQNSYDLSNLQVHEMWIQHVATGDFRDFISDMYNGKIRAQKGSLMRDLYKRHMNAGVHGKTITKTHRRERVFYDGVDQLLDVVYPPKYQSTIGFTAMQNARERLLRDCRLVQEAGYKVMMCDTDSMVVNATEDQIRAVLCDKISKKTKTMQDLGKFEFETDKDGNIEFDTFKCWGLKRYVEITNGQYRKSAFAGMREEVQPLLVDYKTDGTLYNWTQLGARTDQYGKNIMMVPKTMKAENIWYEDDGEDYHAKGANWLVKDLERYGIDYAEAKVRDMMSEIYDNDILTEDMIAYLEDIRYDEIDPYWRRHVKKAYEAAMSNDLDFKEDW